jgi:RNA polymerase sigma factor (TIGR02999 family)
MSDRKAGDLSRLLDGVNGQAPGAFARLIEAVYSDLKRIAANRLPIRLGAPSDQLTVPPTAIAHDAIMELMEQANTFRNTGHFFAIATMIIERQISTYRKQRNAKKRGGGDRGGQLHDGIPAGDHPAKAVDAADAPALRALQELHAINPRQAEVLTLHVLCDYSIPKVAEMIEMSESQTERDWASARKFLKSALSSGNV